MSQHANFELYIPLSLRKRKGGFFAFDLSASLPIFANQTLVFFVILHSPSLQPPPHFHKVG